LFVLSLESFSKALGTLRSAGDADFICNWLGNRAWVHALPWPGKAAFTAAPVLDWTVDGAKAGEVRSAKGLTFLRVFGAGHMVPMDQPANALAMVNAFVHGGM
jgi:cathepsin A (carboxypeptidase C)